ncbi:protein ALP1-like [Bactrocera tryoni]|uniref:protein ALP1-like n=1 Tax=Bactrocera tryoni TaxID=59916 RepID=UPI001A96BD37|nr:protein ALP1-like [Bactrocera tryoni]
MSVAKYNLLLSLLKQRLKRFSNRKPILPETRLAVTLIFLAQGCNFNVLSWSFKLGVSTVRKIIYETCEAIWDELHDAYLSTPNAHELRDIASKFYVKTGMPNCLRAIDGKHIRITSPRNSGSLYYNYKKTFSIVLMAVSDANYVFTYVDVGALGSQNDGGIFARSAFGKKLLNGTLEVPSDTNLPGTTNSFPYYYVGDSAFPLKPNLMRPFPGRHLPEDKDKFNLALSRARVHIENAFGILANRWRVLHTTIHACPKNADKIVLATVVLHNFLMLQNDRNYFTLELADHSEGNREIPGRWREEANSLESFQPRVANRSTANAFQLRETLKEYISNNAV